MYKQKLTPAEAHYPRQRKDLRVDLILRRFFKQASDRNLSTRLTNKGLSVFKGVNLHKKIIIMQLQKYYIGVDVSKHTLDFAMISEGEQLIHEQIANTVKSIQKLFKMWQKQFGFELSECLICMENTGVYCFRLLEFLEGTEAKTCVENAYALKRSQGLQRGKNDKVDAQRIALYAWKNRDFIKSYNPPKETIKKLKRLYSLRKNIAYTKMKFTTSLQETISFVDKETGSMLKKGCKRTVTALEKDKLDLEIKMKEIIFADPELKHLYDLIITVDGVGPMTAIMFIITTNGFTTFENAKKYACFAGVVPFENTSGISIKGKARVSHMANKDAKVMLHLCAMIMSKFKGDLGDYYRRKIAEGKSKMSVLNALRNKIVLRVFACVREDRPYIKNYQKNTP